MGVLFTSKDRIEIVKISDGHYVVMADELEMARINTYAGFSNKNYITLVKETEEKQNKIDSLRNNINLIKENMTLLRRNKNKEREKRMKLEKLVLKLNLKLLEITENRSF